MPFAYAARTAPTAQDSPRRPLRWCAVLAAVLIWHALAAAWFATHRDPSAAEVDKPPVEVALLRPQPIAREPMGASAAPNVPAAQQARAPRPAAGSDHALRAQSAATAEAPPKAAFETTSEATPEAAHAPAGPSQTTAASAPAATPGSAAPGARGSTTAAPGKGNGNAPEQRDGVKFSVPPSGELRYDTFYNGVRNAPGTIHWRSGVDSYDMVVSIPVPFVGTFTYSSSGRIDGFGLAPERYVEQRGGRPGQATTFDRGADRIAFTRTGATLALPDGAQDRFSMVMQLASLVRGDPDAYTPGVTRNFYVADSDSGETWPIETIGDESVPTPQGFVNARHFMRLPRHADDARRIDIWLAPELGWLPVRIRQTEPGGTQVELVWHGTLAAPGAENAPSKPTPAEPSGVAPARSPAREEP